MTPPRIPCRYAIGHCPFGDGCMFDHHLETRGQFPVSGKQGVDKLSGEIPFSAIHTSNTAALPSPTSPVLCKYYAKGSCLFGESCRNLHLQPPKPTNRTTVCKYYKSGACIYGEKCRYEHSSTVSHMHNDMGRSTMSELSCLLFCKMTCRQYLRMKPPLLFPDLLQNPKPIKMKIPILPPVTKNTWSGRQGQYLVLVQK